MLIDISEGNIFTRSFGSGNAVLAMHGGLGLDHTYLVRGLEPLSAQARWTLYDHRGNGRSTRPANFRDLSIGELAEDAERLREKMGLDQMVLFGHSYGGVIALEYALRHPSRLSGLILCNAAPCFGHMSETVPTVMRRMTAEQQAAFGALGAADLTDESLGRHFAALLPLYFHRPDADVLRSISGSMVYSAQACAVSMGEWLQSFDYRPRLREIQVPTLVMGGTHDWVAPPEEACRVLANGMPHAEFSLFDKSGHYPFIEEPERFAEVVRGWLERLA